MLALRLPTVFRFICRRVSPCKLTTPRAGGVGLRCAFGKGEEGRQVERAHRHERGLAPAFDVSDQRPEAAALGLLFVKGVDDDERRAIETPRHVIGDRQECTAVLQAPRTARSGLILFTSPSGYTPRSMSQTGRPGRSGLVCTGAAIGPPPSVRIATASARHASHRCPAC